jgi:hypothetical protein
MAYLVNVYYPNEGVLAQTRFEVLPDAEAFFSHQVKRLDAGPVEVWLKKQQGRFEEYLLNYCKRGAWEAGSKQDGIHP